MRRPVPLLLSLAALALAAAGCEKKAQSPAAPTPAPSAQGGPAGGPPPSGDAILLGVVASLTGSQATFGISTQRGVQMAIDEANAAGGVHGKQLAVRVYDSQGKPEEGASAVTRLIAQDKVVMVLGEVASSVSLAMAEKAQAAGVPMITPSSTNVQVTEKGPNIFRVCFIDPFQGYVAAKFARENLKATRAVVLQDNRSAYSMDLAQVFTRKFTEMGGKVLDTQTYSTGDTDYRGQITALKKQKPEVIYVPGYYSEVGVIARQAKELGLSVPLLGGDGWDSEKLFELSGGALEGSYFSNHYSPDDPSERVQNFIKNYKAKWGGVPDALAALGYDAGLVAVDALKRAPDTSPAALRTAIAQTKDFRGVTGNITLDEKRNAVKPAVVMKVGDGKYEFVTTVQP